LKSNKTTPKKLVEIQIKMQNPNPIFLSSKHRHRVYVGP
jgi:hypothetical protein